jgi:hypothetical protein
VTDSGLSRTGLREPVCWAPEDDVLFSTQGPLGIDLSNGLDATIGY